ncbi:hypothetical protein FRB94_008527 [Tulasnella sp. JGI-2019a]|nr:hypothetical protein FRB93_008911 [Tulasnella sp. JGI-2019a]KAG8996166.1 hypothetical protein FRB94_008527 [Tulasnella sp. JGI-2019a]
MAVFSRIVIGVTLASALIASVAGSPSGSPGSDLKVRHAQHARRGRHGKRTQCAAKTIAADAASTAVQVAAASSSTAPTTTKSVVKTTTKSTAAAAATTTKAATTSSSGVKAGLSWTDISISQSGWLDGASWCYNWGTGPCSKQGLENIPMFWGTKTISAWQSDVMGKSWGHILGMNEPNIASQSNLSPQAAASLWMQYIEPVTGKKGSPAVTTGSDGLTWMKQFMAACDKCTIDFMVVHHYTIDPDSAISFITEFHTQWPDMEIWITEIGCMDYSGKGVYCDQGTADNMMEKVQSWVNTTPWITHWAWYLPAKTTNIDYSNLMMNGDGSPTTFGKKFLGQA